MTKDDVVSMLKAKNPRASMMDLTLFATVYLEYRVAAENIAAHGTVILHPRTGEPSPNPYLPIRDRSVKMLQSMKLATPPEMWT
jgi:phage terminase small subunit